MSVLFKGCVEVLVTIFRYLSVSTVGFDGRSERTNLAAMHFSWVQVSLREKGLAGHKFKNTFLHTESFSVNPRAG